MDNTSECQSQDAPYTARTFNTIITADSVENLKSAIVKKRKRKEWVYKSEYDKLKFKFELMRAAAVSGWALWIIAVAIIASKELLKRL